MDKDRLIKISEDVENQPNKDLVDARDFLIDEHEKTKKIIVDLTRHLESIEILYNKFNEELGKRIK